MLAAALAAFSAGFLAGDPPSCAPERTVTVDVVELLSGKENPAPGKPELFAMHEGYMYTFASESSLRAFKGSPSKFAAQDGGACGRMGPLSGLGSSIRYAAHDGKLYFFASEPCKATFLKEPAKYIEADDPDPRPRVDGPLINVQEFIRLENEGSLTLDAVAAWAGGAGKLGSLGSYRQTRTTKEKQGRSEYTVTRTLTARFPDSFLTRENWDGEDWKGWSSVMCSALHSDKPKPPAPELFGAMASSSEPDGEAIAPSRRRAFERAMSRELVTILRAALDERPDHQRRVFDERCTVQGGGEGTVMAGGKEIPVRFARVWLHGAATRLAVEKDTGRPVQLSYKGRGPSLAIGEIVHTFTNYSTVDGLTLPTAWAVTFDGKDAGGVTLDRFEVNPKLDEGLFARPKK